MPGSSVKLHFSTLVQNVMSRWYQLEGSQSHYIKNSSSVEDSSLWVQVPSLSRPHWSEWMGLLEWSWPSLVAVLALTCCIWVCACVFEGGGETERERYIWRLGNTFVYFTMVCGCILQLWLATIIILEPMMVHKGHSGNGCVVKGQVRQ